MLLATGGLVLPAAASATQITVNTTFDAAPTGTECSGHPNDCSLRQAIDKAPSGGTVLVPAATKHYLLTLGAIDLNKALTIRGGGPSKTIIDGHGSNGVFIKDGGTTTVPEPLTIEGVTITGAKSTGVALEVYTDSAAIIADGVGNVTLSNCVITGNSATAPSSPSAIVAGAIDSESGSLTISHCSITHNHVTASPAESVFAGGIVSEAGPLVVTSSNVSSNSVSTHGNQPEMGGALVSQGGGLTITGSTVSSNVSVAGSGTGTSVNAGGIESDDPTTITNSTIAANSDTGTGAYNAGGYINNSGPAKLTYVTLTGNAGGAAANLVSYGPFTSFGSVFALPRGGRPDCLLVNRGTSTSSGYNFSDQASCGLGASTDRNRGGNPRLAPLGNYGGPALTELPLSPSPLIDAIPKKACVAGIKSDERGLPRPDSHEARCDIGAVETQARPTKTTVTCRPNPVKSGKTSTCTATVVETGVIGRIAPTGTVTASLPSTRCTLAPIPAGESRCSFHVTQKICRSCGPESLPVVASYGGDREDLPSKGKTTLRIEQ